MLAKPGKIAARVTYAPGVRIAARCLGTEQGAAFGRCHGCHVMISDWWAWSDD